MNYIVYRHSENHGNIFLGINFEDIRTTGSLYQMNDQAHRPYVEADQAKPEKAFYYVVNDEAQAIKVAEYCASRTPGVDWYWAKIQGKVASKMAPITTTSYNEKGALPK